MTFGRGGDGLVECMDEAMGHLIGDVATWLSLLCQRIHIRRKNE